jgi:hypothetical protein
MIAPGVLGVKVIGRLDTTTLPTSGKTMGIAFEEMPYPIVLASFFY